MENATKQVLVVENKLFIFNALLIIGIVVMGATIQNKNTGNSAGIANKNDSVSTIDTRVKSAADNVTPAPAGNTSQKRLPPGAIIPFTGRIPEDDD